MDLEIKEKKEQKLLARLEIKAKISFSANATPSNDDVKAAIAKEVGKDAKLVVVKHIYTKFGDASADVFAYVYDNDKKLDELENKHKKPKKKKQGEEGSESVDKAVESKLSKPKGVEAKAKEKPAKEVEKKE